MEVLTDVIILPGAASADMTKRWSSVKVVNDLDIHKNLPLVKKINDKDVRVTDGDNNGIQSLYINGGQSLQCKREQGRLRSEKCTRTKCRPEESTEVMKIEKNIELTLDENAKHGTSNPTKKVDNLYRNARGQWNTDVQTGTSISSNKLELKL